MKNLITDRPLIKPTPTEIRVGRLMRAPDHPADGGDGFGGFGGFGETPPAGDNPDGNNADTEREGDSDNPSQEDPLGSFWGDKEPDDKKSESLDDDKAADTQLGAQIKAVIDGFRAEVFTDEVVEAMQNGDTKAVDAALSSMAQNVMTQTIQQNVKIMERMSTQLLQRVQEIVNQRVESSQTRTKTESLLSREFAQYNQPAVKPVIDRVYQQALTNTGGNQKAALALTQQMIKAMNPDADRTPPGGSMSNEQKSKQFIDDFMNMNNLKG